MITNDTANTCKLRRGRHEPAAAQPPGSKATWDGATRVDAVRLSLWTYKMLCGTCIQHLVLGVRERASRRGRGNRGVYAGPFGRSFQRWIEPRTAVRTYASRQRPDRECFGPLVKRVAGFACWPAGTFLQERTRLKLIQP
jgi:hypothetical protein